MTLLHVDLEEEIWIACPAGMVQQAYVECLLLKKTIYGLVQSMH
jgi:hypothetical protein